MRLPAPVRALRPHQWVKNLFVLAPALFLRGERHDWSLAEPGDLVRSLLALGAFCLASSTIYLVNDVFDVESDRRHPEKRKRPIASGELSIPAAWLLAALCAAGAVVLGLAADGDPPGVLATVGLYAAINVAYSAKLKHVVLVDAFCIAGGFILRVLAGGLAAGAQVSSWLLLCTLFLSLFLALCKRRAEADLLGEVGAEHRATLSEYDRGFLDQMITVLAAVTILCYAMYTVSPETVAKFGDGRLVWTVPFVVFGLGRYMLLVQTQRGGGSPTRILLGADAMFLANLLGWVLVVALIFLRAL